MLSWAVGSIEFTYLFFDFLQLIFSTFINRILSLRIMFTKSNRQTKKFYFKDLKWHFAFSSGSEERDFNLRKQAALLFGLKFRDSAFDKMERNIEELSKKRWMVSYGIEPQKASFEQKTPTCKNDKLNMSLYWQCLLFIEKHRHYTRKIYNIKSIECIAEQNKT